MKQGEGTRTILKTPLLTLLFFTSLFCILTLPIVKADPGWQIDLFCERDGKGLHIGCHSAYRVGERIILYALVTYNEEPVQSVIVAFEVDNPLSSPVVVGAVLTNASGVASINFTITENVYSEYPSLWNSIATTSPAQTTVNDTMYFRIVPAVGGVSTPVLTSPYTYALIIETLIILAFIPAAKAPRFRRTRHVL